MLVGVAAAALLSMCALLPTVFLPKRWTEIHPGMHRAQVHAVLGFPDADFYVAKGYESWHNAFYVGASVIHIDYAYPSDHDRRPTGDDVVTRRVIETVWGFQYLEWSHNYRTFLEPGHNK
jgi:hypothetical protein